MRVTRLIPLSYCQSRSRSAVVSAFGSSALLSLRFVLSTPSFWSLHFEGSGVKHWVRKGAQNIAFPSVLQWRLDITKSLGPGNFVCYIRYLVIPVVGKQLISMGPNKIVCYIRYFVISDLFISSFHCIWCTPFTLTNCTITDCGFGLEHTSKIPLEVVADLTRQMQLFWLRSQIMQLWRVHIKRHYLKMPLTPGPYFWLDMKGVQAFVTRIQHPGKNLAATWECNKGPFHKGSESRSESCFISRFASWMSSWFWTMCVHKHCNHRSDHEQDLCTAT